MKPTHSTTRREARPRRDIFTKQASDGASTVYMFVFHFDLEGSRYNTQQSGQLLRLPCSHRGTLLAEFGPTHSANVSHVSSFKISGFLPTPLSPSPHCQLAPALPPVPPLDRKCRADCTTHSSSVAIQFRCVLSLPGRVAS